MAQLPDPVHVAVLGLVIGAVMSILALAQRFGEWRSKLVARLLGALAAVLMACWAYLAVLWVFQIDLRIWIAGYKWLVTAGAFSVVGLLAWYLLALKPESLPTATALSPERREIVLNEFAKFTEAERVAICCIAVAPMSEQTLRERVEARGLTWNSDIPSHLHRQLVSHDFSGLFYVLSDYKDAVQEICPRANTGILSINTGAFRH